MTNLDPHQQLAARPAPLTPTPAAAAPAATAAPVAAPAAGVSSNVAGAVVNPAQAALFQRNQAYLADGQHTYNTVLTPEQEQQFRAWLADKSDKQDLGRAEFDPNAKTVNYDMRGWWLAASQGDEKAKLVIDPNDKLKHRNDYWKTPYHETFSAESQWAGQNAPKWNDKDQLVAPDGTIIFDDRAQKKEGDK
jgi:hypothetical protein